MEIMEEKFNPVNYVSTANNEFYVNPVLIRDEKQFQLLTDWN